MSAPPVESRTEQPVAHVIEPDTADALRTSWLQKAEQFPRWWWAAVPLLAVIAYITVLRVGFLSDDYIFLHDRQGHGFNIEALLPRPYPYWRFYRPVGLFFTWDLGWLTWGYNALPYHMLGLFLHAVVALMLGLCAAEVAGRRIVGWLAGALFAVFPLHMEAAAWISAQFDEFAALFGLLSLFLFVLWWKRPGSGRAYYLLSFLSFVLGLISKESLLSWAPILGVAAWAVTPRFGRAQWRKLLLALLPYGLVLAGYVTLRLVMWGSVGNYPWASTNYGDFFWDSLTTDAKLLLSPLNASITGKAAAQVVGALASGAILLGIVLYGRRYSRVLAVSGAWVVLGLLPVLNLPVTVDTLENNRYLYLPAAGYCMAVAVLLYAAIKHARTWKWAAVPVVALLALGCVASWVQLIPWHTATVLAHETMNELHSIVPPSEQPQTWYAENLPNRYRGAYIFLQGANLMRFFSDGDLPDIKGAPNAEAVSLGNAPSDAFALRFVFSPADTRYHVTYAAGITSDNAPPTGQGATTWDLRSCVQSALDAWRVKGATPTCEAGKGLIMAHPGPDAQMLGPSVTLAGDGAKFFRLRASVSYPAATKPGALSQWYWHGPGESWAEEHSRVSLVRPDGKPYVYWTYIPAPSTGDRGVTLRFDPANDVVPAEVGWLAVDVVR